MDKSPDAFRTISEVAEDLALPQHVLRFWETRFAQIRPLKRGGGRRYYRPDDVELLKGIRHLLYGEGYTIKGVQRILKAEGLRFVQSVGRGEQSVAAPPPETAFAEQDITEEAPDSSPEMMSAAQALAPDDLQRLHAALEELSECDRVLSNLKIEGDAAPGK
jgi:DNA-binding transcriptional MerR regulator